MICMVMSKVKLYNQRIILFVIGSASLCRTLFLSATKNLDPWKCDVSLRST
jgi:hypothetical protein